MKLLPPDFDQLLERAQQRDLVALQRLYAQAAAWLRAGEIPPPELAKWLADRCQGVAQAVFEHKAAKQIQDAAAVALMVRRAGAKGTTKSFHAERFDSALVGDVLHFMEWHGYNAHQAQQAVAAFHSRNGGPDLTERIKAAWKERGTLNPKT